MLSLRIALTLGSLTALAPATPHLVPPDDHKLLLIDPRIVVSSQNAKLVPGRVIKEPLNPLFLADRPWENCFNNLYPNLLWDQEEQIFKLWYKCVLSDRKVIEQMDGPSTIHDVGWYLLYATSKDGLNWDKPALGLFAHGGDRKTNIVARDTPNVGVFKDSHETNPTRRYKMVYDVGLGKPRARFSPDGIHWSEPVEMLGFGARNGDTHNNAFWDERTRKYLWFTKLYLGERLVARFESEDFLHWKNNGLVLRSTLTEGRASQTYCMPVFRYANSYLAWLMMYHPGTDRSVDCELAWSPDGLHWQRVFPGVPFIPRGPEGSFDSKCIYAMAGPPVGQDGNLLIFYGGDDFPHTGWKRDCVPCLARLPLDQFGGFQPLDDNPGHVITRALNLQPEGLHLSADASVGSITVFALSSDDQTLAESEPLSGALHDAKIVWKGAAPPSGCRLKFTLNRATLFAIGGAALVDPSLPKIKRPMPPLSPIRVRRTSFDHDTEDWTGVDTLTHHPTGGKSGGYVSASRQGRNLPIARSTVGPDDPLDGDWPVAFGGQGARISAWVRAAKSGGTVQIEIFARDVAPWTFATSTEFETEWQEVSAPLRYDWTDEEAQAAGWRPSVYGFSWAETIRNVGRIVLVPTAAEGQAVFDLDEVTVTGLAQ